MKKLLVWLVIWLALTLPVEAAGNLVYEDDFATGDNWQEVANYQHQNPNLPCRGPDSAAYHWELNNGQADLKITQSVPCTVVSLPNSYTSRDVTHLQIEFDWYLEVKQADRNWLLLWQDQDNYLGFHVFDDHIYLEKRINGQNFVRDDYRQYYDFVDFTPYHVRIDYQPTKHLFFVYLNDELAWELYESPDEPQLTSGTPGLMGSVGAAVPRSVTHIDNWQWWEFDHAGTNLAVTQWKQTDESWGQAIYDQAQAWSLNEDTSIKRWGCALTAAAMVANYHHLTTLPDGTLLNPGSLNSWLSNQPDGYWPEGLINWRAISRLSSLVARNNPDQPQLEFAFQNPASRLTWLQRQLDQNRPVILAEPNHFVVSRGYEYPSNSNNIGNSTWLINDPFYTYTSLQPYGNTFETARLYTPSHTNLSAISVVVPNNWQLIGNDDELPFIWETSPLGNRWKVYDLAKPEESNYSWLLTTSGRAVGELTIMAYQQDGQVAVSKQYLSPSNESTSIHIDLTSSQNVIYTSSQDLKITAATWSQWLQQEKIGSPFIHDEWTQLINSINEAADLERAQQLHQQSLEKLSTFEEYGWLSPTVNNILKQRLDESLVTKFP